MVINRFEIYWVNLNSAAETEMQKVKQVVVISPDEMNSALGTVLVAPLTLRERLLPTRLRFELNKSESYIALDQIRAIDKSYLTHRITVLNQELARELSARLQEMFAY